MLNLLPTDELNSLKTELLKRKNSDGSSDNRINEKQCIDTVLDILLTAYAFGCLDANEELGTEISPSKKEIERSVYKKTAGEDFTERLKKYTDTSDEAGIMRVAETEAHRVYNEAVVDTASAHADSFIGSGKEPVTIYKRWSTMKDDRVRDTHDYLEGMKIPYDAEFVTFDGDRAMAPGGFENAENNANCRCVLQLSTQ